MQNGIVKLLVHLDLLLSGLATVGFRENELDIDPVGGFRSMANNSLITRLLTGRNNPLKTSLAIKLR
jgi:hypothetical protein